MELLGGVDAKKVKLLRKVFEDDFPEYGMVAWLTDIEECGREECYKLHFDFKEFESYNDKYLKQVYYPNSNTTELERFGRKLFNAKEAGLYSNKYSVYFGDLNKTKQWNLDELYKHLEILEGLGA